MFDGKLETFIKVAECGSFTKAAEDLYITPTAVMKQINALEKDLSVTLFDRSNHGLRITKSGEAFLQDARYILEYISRAEQKAREIFEGENRKSIRIGTSVMTPAKSQGFIHTPRLEQVYRRPARQAGGERRKDGKF